MGKSTRKPAGAKVLWQHKSGRWAKRVRGKCYYFSKDYNEAIEQWLRAKDHLYAGKDVPAEGYIVRDLLNRYMDAQDVKVANGDMGERWRKDCLRTCERIRNAIGVTQLLKTLDGTDGLKLSQAIKGCPVTRRNTICRVNAVFRYAYDAGMVDSPIRLALKGPKEEKIRQHLNNVEEKYFEAKEIKSLLESAGPVLRSMIYLGINCGFGATDLAELDRHHINAEPGWIDYPRTKNGKARRVKLWPETIEALRVAMPLRPAPKDPAHSERLYITRFGRLWVYREKQGSDKIAQEFDKLQRALKIKRRGVNFYSLRHTFHTVAGDTTDTQIVDFIAGRAPDTVGEKWYRTRVADHRIIHVVNHVRQWLFPDAVS